MIKYKFYKHKLLPLTTVYDYSCPGSKHIVYNVDSSQLNPEDVSGLFIGGQMIYILNEHVCNLINRYNYLARGNYVVFMDDDGNDHSILTNVSTYRMPKEMISQYIEYIYKISAVKLIPLHNERVLEL